MGPHISVLSLAVLVVASATRAQTLEVLVVGDDMYCTAPPIVPTLTNAGISVTQAAGVSDLDGADLSVFDVVWLRNGVDPNNTGCAGTNTIPSAAASANLASFVAAGGGLYLSGENGGTNLNSLNDWKDAFLSDTLGAGTVASCPACDLGTTIHLDPTVAMNTTPNTIATVGASTIYTGGFDQIGTGTPIAFGSASLDGPPVAVLWDRGDLTLAPAGRAVAWNNHNNTTSYAEWAVNAVHFLAGDDCPADLTGEGDVNTNDFFAFLAFYQAQDPRADFSPGGGINTNDFFAYLAAYQAGC